MTLKELAIARKARKGTAAGITPDGAYWLAVKVDFNIAGGDGIGQSAPAINDYLVVRHYRSGEIRAYAQRESWHRNRGEYQSRMRRDSLLDCSTIEELIQTIESIPLEAGEYEIGHYHVTPPGRQRMIDDLEEMAAALPGPDEA